MAAPAVKGFPPRGVFVLMLLFLISPLIPVQAKYEIPRDYVGFIAFAMGILLAITIEYCRLYFALTGPSAATVANSVDMPKLRMFDSCNIFGFVAFIYIMILASMYSVPNPTVASSWACVACTIVLFLLYRRVYEIYQATVIK